MEEKLIRGEINLGKIDLGIAKWRRRLEDACRQEMGGDDAHRQEMGGDDARQQGFGKMVWEENWEDDVVRRGRTGIEETGGEGEMKKKENENSQKAGVEGCASEEERSCSLMKAGVEGWRRRRRARFWGSVGDSKEDMRASE
ncbi:hypothetical protein ACLOJK_019531 [Asimina triloba]